MSVIQINDQALIDKLQSVSERLQNTLPLSQAIAQSLDTVTQDNFDAEGRPSWAGLSPVTIAKRKSGKMLYQEGTLRRSITTQATKDEAIIGSNVVYAAIQHFGGMAGRNKKVKIPARPNLPMDENSNLQPEAEDAIFDDVDFYWRKIFD